MLTKVHVRTQKFLISRMPANPGPFPEAVFEDRYGVQDRFGTTSDMNITLRQLQETQAVTFEPTDVAEETTTQMASSELEVGVVVGFVLLAV